MCCSWVDRTFEMRCWPWKGWGREHLAPRFGEGRDSAHLKESDPSFIFQGPWGWGGQHPENLTCCSRTRLYRLWPTCKISEGFQVHTDSVSRQPWVSADWRGKEGIWLVLIFILWSLSLRIESLPPGVPFLFINSDTLCPHSLLGAVLGYRAHNSVCLFSE